MKKNSTPESKYTVVEADSIGELIAKLRKANGYTQAQLASKINTTNIALSRWEQGTFKPSQSNINALANAFSLPVDVMLKMIKSNPSESLIAIYEKLPVSKRSLLVDVARAMLE